MHLMQRHMLEWVFWYNCVQGFLIAEKIVMCFTLFSTFSSTFSIGILQDVNLIQNRDKKNQNEKKKKKLGKNDTLSNRLYAYNE